MDRASTRWWTVGATPPVPATTFLDGLAFGESPRWHDGRLWYSDFYSQAVFSVAADGKAPVCELSLEDRPSGLGWLPTGDLLVVSMGHHEVLRRRAGPGGRALRHADLSPVSGPGDINDMLVLDDGTAFVGQFGFDLQDYFGGRAAPATTALVRVDPDGAVHEAADDLSFPNGMTLLGTTLVVAETFAMRLSAFEVGEDRNLQHRRQWAALDACAPDGICADAEGAVWVANALAPECLRVGAGGRVLERAVTSQPCFACALGGDDRRTLFCCTAPSSDARVVSRQRAGRIEAVTVSVAGVG
ncbi:MAG TPA: SMP-30/gluconolactonase/LRE family protein [Acidimicrobiales bacterium]|nr:SMP-30/gluconolactonase/LRE family protein [Acidimicrobiales bacterium]